jgi:hypothetical protein
VGQCASQLDARVPRQVCFTGGFDVAVSLVAMSSHTPSSLQAELCVHVDCLGPTGRRAAFSARARPFLIATDSLPSHYTLDDQPDAAMHPPLTPRLMPHLAPKRWAETGRTTTHTTRRSAPRARPDCRTRSQCCRRCTRTCGCTRRVTRPTNGQQSSTAGDGVSCD